METETKKFIDSYSKFHKIKINDELLELIDLIETESAILGISTRYFRNNSMHYLDLQLDGINRSFIGFSEKNSISYFCEDIMSGKIDKMFYDMVEAIEFFRKELHSLKKVSD